MAYPTQQMAGGAAGAWGLAQAQHGVVSRRQLLALGLTGSGIKHRTSRGRLHQVTRGVYAVGRPALTAHGRWMAAVLACGGDEDRDGRLLLRQERKPATAVVLSHDS